MQDVRKRACKTVEYQEPLAETGSMAPRQILPQAACSIDWRHQAGWLLNTAVTLIKGQALPFNSEEDDGEEGIINNACIHTAQRTDHASACKSSVPGLPA